MESPTWLASAEHGAIGEARARALLLDRFWVLERSVDVEGADLLVEPKPATKDALDLPRPLARIQVKYLQGSTTTALVPESYVRNKSGKIYPQFFVLVTTGGADATRWYLLGAEDIVRFPIGRKGIGKGRFRLPGRRILVERYRALTASSICDRIERALREAGAQEHARFLSQGLGLPSPKAFEPDFELPLYHAVGSVPKMIDDARSRLRTVGYEIEEALSKIDLAATTGNPVEMVEALDDPAIDDFRNARGSLEFNFRGVSTSDLQELVAAHVARVERLRGEGLVERFFALAAKVEAETRRELLLIGQLRKKRTFQATLRFDPVSLDFHALDIRQVMSRKGREHSWLLNYLEDFGSEGAGGAWIRTNLGGYPPLDYKAAGPPLPLKVSWAEFVDSKAVWISEGLVRIAEALRFGDALD